MYPLWIRIAGSAGAALICLAIPLFAFSRHRPLLFRIGIATFGIGFVGVLIGLIAIMRSAR